VMLSLARREASQDHIRSNCPVLDLTSFRVTYCNKSAWQVFNSHAA